MKTKMNRTQTMMKSPPRVMTPVAARSATLDSRDPHATRRAIFSRMPMLAGGIGDFPSGVAYYELGELLLERGSRAAAGRPSFTTTSWPSLLTISFRYSLTSGSRGLPGALLMEM
jgi:hypothetical protein